jgi:two-component system nitrate/nitrite response regulator NarL
MERVNALLIDPNRLFREDLRHRLRNSSFEIIAEASSLGEGAAAVDAGLRPDLVLLDLANGGEDEVEAMRRLRRLLPDARIVVLTAELCERRLTDTLESGADGYLMKDLSSEALAQSLRLVIMGEKVFPTHLAALLISGRVSSVGLDTPILRKGLSPREGQILPYLVNGESNKTIANRLNITEATVKVHLKSLLRKINASNRTQAAIWALNHGIDGRPPGNAGARIGEDVTVAAE